MNPSMHKTATRLPLLAVAALLASLSLATPAQARDDKLKLPIAAALEANDAKAKLEGVQFYFGDSKTPKVLSKIGTDQTNQKTNAFGKTPETSCNWAFLSAMMALHKHAQQIGANAVINIKSNYKNQPFSSTTEFECHDGALMSGVALKADFVKIAAK
jgi:uncharacterized protein YbjQ (UPF0145 family)